MEFHQVLFALSKYHWFTGNIPRGVFCEQNGIEKYMKFPMFKKETKDQKYHEDPFRAVNFRIDEQGVMRCPNDKAFHFLYRKNVR